MITTYIGFFLIWMGYLLLFIAVLMMLEKVYFWARRKWVQLQDWRIERKVRRYLKSIHRIKF